MVNKMAPSKNSYDNFSLLFASNQLTLNSRADTARYVWSSRVVSSLFSHTHTVYKLRVYAVSFLSGF